MAIGLLSSSKLNSHLTTSLSVPGSASAQADQILSKHFNENIEGTFTVVDNFKNASNSQIDNFENEIAKASLVIPTASVSAQKAVAGVLFVNIQTSLSLPVASRYTSLLRKSLKSAGLSTAMVTGPPAIESDVLPILGSDLHRGEIIGLVIALILLLLTLGLNWSLLIPFIFAAGSISATLCLIFLLAQKYLVVLYIPNIVELIGLGLAIDYSLLMVYRYRAEISKIPHDMEEAVVRTMLSAGKVVAFSGFTVAVALATLIFVPIPFVRSLGIASILVPLLSLAAAFTLQPVLLSFLGAHGKSILHLNHFFARSAHIIIRRPLLIACSSIAALIVLMIPVVSMHLTPSSLTAIPPQLESQKALTLVSSHLGTGVITPNEIIIDLGDKDKSSDAKISQDRVNFSKLLLKNPEVLAVATGIKSPYTDSTGRFIRIFVIGRHSFGAAQSQNLVKQLRTNYLLRAGFPIGATLYLGGAAAQGADLLSVLLRTFPWIVLLALLLTFLLLLRAFKSMVLPLKAILLDLISLTVAFGIVVFAFGSHTIGNVLGVYHLNQIEAWAMVFLFVLLFGVSMDYEVFIISRIKEGRDRGATNSEAILEGITESGIIVTTAALIFIGAVSGLVLGHFAGLQELGIGLVFGVLVDATIIRGLLLPSLMVLLGRWNWWLPTSVARIMKTSPAPLDEVRG